LGDVLETVVAEGLVLTLGEVDERFQRPDDPLDLRLEELNDGLLGRLEENEGFDEENDRLEEKLEPNFLASAVLNSKPTEAIEPDWKVMCGEAAQPANNASATNAPLNIVRITQSPFQVVAV
jgi:hypothetical protein